MLLFCGGCFLPDGFDCWLCFLKRFLLLRDLYSLDVSGIVGPPYAVQSVEPANGPVTGMCPNESSKSLHPRKVVGDDRQ